MSISSLLFLFIFVHSLDKKEKNKKIALQMYANHYGPPIQYLTYVPQVVNYGQPLGAQPLTTVRTYCAFKFLAFRCTQILLPSCTQPTHNLPKPVRLQQNFSTQEAVYFNFFYFNFILLLLLFYYYFIYYFSVLSAYANDRFPVMLMTAFLK